MAWQGPLLMLQSRYWLARVLWDAWLGKNLFSSLFRLLTELICLWLCDWGPWLPTGGQLQFPATWPLSGSSQNGSLLLQSHQENLCLCVCLSLICYDRFMHNKTQSWEWHPITFVIFYWLESSHRFCLYPRGLYMSVTHWGFTSECVCHTSHPQSQL